MTKEVNDEKISFLLLFCFYIINCYASDMDATFTNKQLNGRGWRRFDLNQKASFVVGFREGLYHSSHADINIPNIKEQDVKTVLSALSALEIKATHGEVVEYIDKFYSNLSNSNIPIQEVFDVMFIEYSGFAGDYIEPVTKEKKNFKTNQEAVQSITEGLRRRFNSQ